MSRLRSCVLGAALVLASLLRADGDDGEPPETALLRSRALQELFGDPDGCVERDRNLLRARFCLEEARRPRRAIDGSEPRWRCLGPTNGAGRVTSLAVDGRDPRVVFRGTAGGGVWKTEDGGVTWRPLTDDLGSLSIGAVALAPSDPSIVYVGTGEGSIAPELLGANGVATSDGIGLVRSMDGGRTWTLAPEVVASRFYALSVDPRDARVIVAATSEGVLLSTDGGVSFLPVLAGLVATALARDPSAPARVLASSLEPAGGRFTGAVHLSTDGGTTWARSTGAGGAPLGTNVGRLSLAIAPSAPEIVYALAAAADGNGRPGCSAPRVDQKGFFRSTDGGRTFAFVSDPGSACDAILGSNGWWANALTVDPADPATVFAGGVDVWKTTDSGATWARISSWTARPGTARYVHADVHDFAWAPSRLLVGDDGGVGATGDGGNAFSTLDDGVVTRQFYALAVTPANRDLVLGGAQDDGISMRNATTAFRTLVLSDGFGCAADPRNEHVLFGSIYGSQIFRLDGGTSVVGVTPRFTSGEKRPFMTPLCMDPTNPMVLYTGSQYLYRTEDGGSSWRRTSDADLGDGAASGYLTKIAVSQADPRRLLTATGGGAVKLSTDGGLTWTAALSGGLPSGRYASHVEFDPRDASIFYVAYTGVDLPSRLFRTNDGGATFAALDAGLPQLPIHVVRVDPLSSAILYAGTEAGLFRSTDTGRSWSRVGVGLPPAAVWDAALFPDGSVIRVATHGRGVWELPLGDRRRPVPGLGDAVGSPVRR